MSVVEQASLYQERIGTVTSPETIDQYLSELAAAKSKWRETALSRRIELAQACLDGMMQHVETWVEEACRAKGIPAGSPMRSEEIGNGPLATARYLRLLMQTLRDIAEHGTPRLPGEIATGPDGRLRVQVVPTRGLFDSIAFKGFKAHVWMQEGVTRDNLAENMAGYYRRGCQDEGISLILGAGNVSSIAPTDTFSKLFHEGKVVLLKMNPVNEYLGPIFERAFAPLIRENLLRIVYGGADVGSYAIGHDLVDEVHITGSIYSHETICWGPPGPERDRRKADNDPVLKKAITSELGNVTPWVVVPGRYSDRELKFHAENLASTILNNASFNCIATKMVVTSRHWPQRGQFLDYLEAVLNNAPRRKAYYPGAEERYRRFAGREPGGDQPDAFPWTLVRDVSPERDPHFFDEESFVCVFAETALDAAEPADFLRQATDFCNERLWGTLGAALMIHPSTRADAAFEAQLQRSLADLRYGTVAINHWPALSYAMMSPPWGGYPGGTIHDPKSGIGWVHNTYLFDRAEKTVLEGPLTMSPKPLWFPSNRNAEAVTWKVLELYHKPSVWRLPGLLLAAIKG